MKTSPQKRKALKHLRGEFPMFDDDVLWAHFLQAGDLRSAVPIQAGDVKGCYPTTY